ncbi:MAG: hypothetical protein AAF668_03685 [Pseudomonadota bacterium]
MQTDPLERIHDGDTQDRPEPELLVVDKTFEAIPKRLPLDKDEARRTFDLKLALVLSFGLWAIVLSAGYFLAIVVF